ncbi:MAG: Tol-Pal system beta propeller repeat protein TolB [Pseudomonadales bacterium]|jgi:TolB protein|nr:Tol-Pal system beta propeller repeat protein TolB [Pseudomonadales bacterium]
MNKLLQGFLLLLAALLTQMAAAQQLNIQITQGVDNPVPIAVVPFGWKGFGTLPESITDIVNKDLSNSGQFSTVPERNMLSTPHEQNEVFFRDWRFLGADYLLIGKIDRSEGSNLVQVQYELFDAVRETRMVGEVISGTEVQLRDIAHQISDVVYEQITGIRGAFSTKILYVTSQRISDSLTNYQLNLSDADGGRPQVLLQSREPIMSPTWAPDARRIAYVSFESSRPRIYIQDLSSGKREQITDFPGLNSSPAFSPDGKSMAMVLSKDGNPDIFVMDLATKQLRKITTHFAVDTEPCWLPNGRALVYTSEQGGANRPQIYQVNLDTGFTERVTFEGTYNSKPLMLPDGKNLVMVHRYDSSDEFHLALMNLERGTVRVLTNTSLDESPTLAPNASMIMYASKANGRGILNAVSIDGRVKYQLPVNAGDVREPAWSPFLD